MKYLVFVALVLLVSFAFSTGFSQAQEVPTGGITIILDTTPETPDVNFDFNIRDVDNRIPAWTVSEFTLEDEGDQNTQEFVDLPEGRYRVTALGKAGWVIVDSECRDVEGDSTWEFSGAVEGIVTINLNAGAFVECTFTYSKLVTPTPAPTSTPVPSTPTVVPATPTPAPVATVAPQVIILQQPPAVIPTLAPTSVPAQVGVIRPPSTGSAGLKALQPVSLAAWGDENDGASLFDSYCPGW